MQNHFKINIQIKITKIKHYEEKKNRCLKFLHKTKI